MTINETVLEMHFHRALMDLFRDTLGLGPTGKINFYKYSPQRECFVGFDQAWVATDASEGELFHDLKEAARGNYSLGDRYLGYFLQFKVVKKLEKYTGSQPRPVSSTPFGRVQLYTQANAKTGKSQHELLFNLSQNLQALTYYACPMIFDKTELYKADVDLAKLALVDLQSCPGPFRDHQKHHIYFDLSSMKPTWCSEPVEGTQITPKEFVRKAVGRINGEEWMGEVRRLLDVLGYLKESRQESLYSLDAKKEPHSVWDALTIVRVSRRGGGES